MLLLRRTDLRIEEIAVTEGCATSRHFSSLFQRVIAVPSSRFRAQQRQ